MTKLLIVTATREEAAFLSKSIKKAKPGDLISLPPSGTLHTDVLITGPGMVATTYHLTRSLLANRYDLALNIGICGSLDPSIAPVRVVNIHTDQFGDFGAEDGTSEMDVFEMKLIKKNEPPFTNGKLKANWNTRLNSLQALPIVNGITVQKVHGSTAGCKRALKKFGPVMESMEGASFFYVCHLQRVKCLQLRAVSNKVEKRNRAAWKIREALDALSGITGLLLLELENRI